ncbi:hypothetical protein [Stenotrophomonas sp. TWI1183]|uniref:hypothetical protein n=1 Tax=Stenotrophomonas sp. TWI1183 TaxID=3136799 RepID=UPI003207F4A2
MADRSAANILLTSRFRKALTIINAPGRTDMAEVARVNRSQLRRRLLSLAAPRSGGGLNGSSD